MFDQSMADSQWDNDPSNPVNADSYDGYDLYDIERENESEVD